MSINCFRIKQTDFIRARLSFALVLLLLAAFGFSAATAQQLSSEATAGTKTDARTTMSREKRLAIFDDVWEAIYERYYDRTFHGVDWPTQRTMFREAAAGAANSAELYAILRRMIGTLRDAHTRVYAPFEKFDWRRPRAISVGVSVREVAGEAVVTNVERDSEASRAGLRAGDTILRVDDESALAVFARRLRESANSSTPRAARLRAISGLFDGAAGSSVKVRWLDSKGREREAVLRREWRTRTQDLRVKRLSEGYAVIEFDAFTEAAAKDFARLMAGSLRASRGLVIDLRNNGGGEAEAMTEMASMFLPAGNSLGRFTDRTGRAAFAPHTRSALLLSADKVALFRAPLVILTGERTSSAAEIFASALREAHRAVLIGTQTCGCVLAIRRHHALPDGGELYVSEMDYRTALGARLEGTGVIPDEEIQTAKKDLREHRDRAMERALEQLKIINRQSWTSSVRN
ncbi:MAG: S41 family peptidase [Pyrinomonadaceae bacterium]